MNKSLLLGLVLALAAVPAAIVSAHSATCAATNAPHTYGVGGSVGAESQTIGSNGAGVVTVNESNTADCNGDTVPGDYDGDYDQGIGGGFFGAGPWANEAICQYGLKTHGSNVAVTDVISSNIAFVTGADDQSGPIVVPDPVNGGNICETDGSSTPCPDNDPAQCGPTDDADDCLSDTFIGAGSACGFGGDGGYWVFLSGVQVVIDESTTPPGVFVSGAPTTGFIAYS